MPLFLSALAAASLLAAVPSRLDGQRVSGRAFDQASGTPVSEVQVFLADSLGATVAAGRTGPDGFFVLVAPAPGIYRLRFQVPGYRPLVSQPLRLEAGQELSYPLRLSAVPPALLDTLLIEGATVSRQLAGFYRRRANSSWGNFLTRDEFMRFGPVEVTDILRHTPQIQVLADPASGRGYRLVGSNTRRLGQPCPPVILRDGLSIGTADQWDIDLLFTVDGIEAVEVYGSGAGLPAEFWVPGNPCGVVAIWTREPAPRPRPRPIHVTTQAGSRLTSGGPEAGRLGVGLIVALGKGVELAPQLNVLIAGFGTISRSSGMEGLLALRLRPGGQRGPWYAGVGLSAQQVSERIPNGGSPVSRDAVRGVLLSGILVPLKGTARPFIEMRAVDVWRPSGLEWHASVGLAFELHRRS